MDLIRIFHVVDMLSSGKHVFNHIYVVGLILSILIHLNQFSSYWFSFLLWCSSNIGMVLPCVVLFLLCVSFLRFKVLFVFSGFVWYPILHLAFTDDPDVDHPVIVHRECLYRISYTPTSLFIYFLFQPF